MGAEGDVAGGICVQPPEMVHPPSRGPVFVRAWLELARTVSTRVYVFPYSVEANFACGGRGKVAEIFASATECRRMHLAGCWEEIVCRGVRL